jgi:hypothetical protein
MCPRKGLEGQKGRSIPQNAQVKGDGEEVVSSRGSPVRMLGEDEVVGQDFREMSLKGPLTVKSLLKEEGHEQGKNKEGGKDTDFRALWSSDSD